MGLYWFTMQSPVHHEEVKAVIIETGGYSVSVARKKNSMNAPSYPIVFLSVLQDHSPENDVTHIVCICPSDLSTFRLINLST